MNTQQRRAAETEPHLCQVGHVPAGEDGVHELVRRDGAVAVGVEHVDDALDLGLCQPEVHRDQRVLELPVVDKPVRLVCKAKARNDRDP
eukprot:SAG22_NODE_2007_length_3152_cov_3.209630_2_plen_89_part_00